MILSKLSLIFKFVIVAFIYGIIYYALKVMYKDINGGMEKKKNNGKTVGLEVVEIGNNINLKKGSLIPIPRKLSIGRGKRNTLQLLERYVSKKHAVIKLVGKGCYVEDLGSTNGTILNSKRIGKKEWLKSGDVLKVGTSTFRVIE